MTEPEPEPEDRGRLIGRRAVIAGALGFVGGACASDGTLLEEGAQTATSTPATTRPSTAPATTAVPSTTTLEQNIPPGPMPLRSTDVVASVGVGVRAVCPPYRTLGPDKLIERLLAARITLIRGTWYVNEKLATVGEVYKRYDAAGIRVCLLADFQEADRQQQPIDVDYSHQGQIQDVPRDPASILPYGDRLDTGAPDRPYGAARFRSSVLRGDWPVPTYLESLNEPAGFFAAATMYSNIPVTGGEWTAGVGYEIGDAVHVPPDGVKFTCRRTHVSEHANMPRQGDSIYVSELWWPTWVAGAIEHDRRLRDLIAEHEPWAKVQLTTPSFTAVNQDEPFAIAACTNADILAMHNYTTPAEPSYLVQGGEHNGVRYPGVVQEGVRVAPQTKGRCIVTEYGWHTPGSLKGRAKPEDLINQATMHQQAALDYARWRWNGAPFEAWILFELCDFWPESDIYGEFGILDRNGDPKPAYTELSRLLNHLYEETSTARSFAPQTVGVQIDPAPPEVRWFPMQRSDGSHLVAIWRHVIAGDPVPIRLQFSGRYASIEAYRARDDTTTLLATDATACVVEVRPDPVVLRLAPPND